jgi:membrane fusion protein, copper/silver efflux system
VTQTGGENAMNTVDSSSEVGGGPPGTECHGQPQPVHPLVENLDTYRSPYPRFIQAAAMSALGVSLLVIAYLMSLSLLQFERTNNQTVPKVQASPPLEIVTVTLRELYREIKIAGKLDYGEGRIVHATAPISGHIEYIITHSVGEQVNVGEMLASIKSVPLLRGKQEFLQALEAFEPSMRNRDPLITNSSKSPLWMARKKLLLLGVHPSQLTDIEQSRNVDGPLAVESWTAGVLAERVVSVGQQVRVGDVLCKIVKPGPMWLYLNVFVSDLPWVSLGRSVDIDIRTSPVNPFPAVITSVSPVVDPIARTIRIGVPLPNSDGTLKQLMVADATIRVDLLSDGTPEPTGLEGKFICPMHPEFIQDISGHCPKTGLTLVKIPHGRVRQEPVTHGKTLAVPETAVFERNGRTLVRRLMSTGQDEIVKIEVGTIVQGKDEQGQEARYYPVRAGLKEGDRVFVTPKELHNVDAMSASAGHYIDSHRV